MKIGKNPEKIPGKLNNSKIWAKDDVGEFEKIPYKSNN